jgi:hypothetical protein
MGSLAEISEGVILRIIYEKAERKHAAPVDFIIWACADNKDE